MVLVDLLIDLEDKTAAVFISFILPCGEYAFTEVIDGANIPFLAVDLEPRLREGYETKLLELASISVTKNSLTFLSLDYCQK